MTNLNSLCHFNGRKYQTIVDVYFNDFSKSKDNNAACEAWCINAHWWTLLKCILKRVSMRLRDCFFSKGQRLLHMKLWHLKLRGKIMICLKWPILRSKKQDNMWQLQLFKYLLYNVHSKQWEVWPVVYFKWNMYTSFSTLTGMTYGKTFATLMCGIILYHIVFLYSQVAQHFMLCSNFNTMVTNITSLFISCVCLLNIVTVVVTNISVAFNL